MTVSLYSLKTPSDILNAALAQEKGSYAFYSEVLKRVTDESLRDLLKELKDAEDTHIQKVEKMIMNFS